MDRRQFLTALFAAPLAALVALGLRKSALPPSCEFTEADLCLSLDEFTQRYITPAANAIADGLSIRVVQQYDLQQDRFVTRTDALFGYGVIPEGRSFPSS